MVEKALNPSYAFELMREVEVSVRDRLRTALDNAVSLKDFYALVRECHCLLSAACLLERELERIDYR